MILRSGPLNYVPDRYYVELTPPESPWIREAQRAALVVPNVHVGYATAFDLSCAPGGVDGNGYCSGPHTPRKQEVGRRLSLQLLDDIFNHSVAETSGPQLESVSVREAPMMEEAGAGFRVTVQMEFTHAHGLHLNGTAAWCARKLLHRHGSHRTHLRLLHSAFVSAEGRDRGKSVHGPCCSISPFLLRTAAGAWIRTGPPSVSGSTVTVTANIMGGGLASVSDIVYAFEAFPTCALYNGEPNSGPDSHSGLVATPFRRAVRHSVAHGKKCPAKTTLCPAAAFVRHHPRQTMTVYYR
eukprot:COSAG01_NODE_4069_length_5383_cov_6.046556_6_plen_296_part_00